VSSSSIELSTRSAPSMRGRGGRFICFCYVVEDLFSLKRVFVVEGCDKVYAAG